ncbi:MAG: hypothetical protein ACSHYA_00585 [Opitutaceae bacterium]
MKTFQCIYFLGALLFLSGCGPSIVHVQEGGEEKSENSVQAAENVNQPKESVQEPVIAAAPEEPEIVEKTEYAILNEPWNRYFRSEPKVIVVSDISKGMLDLLNQEQELIKSVLDSGGDANNSSEYIALEDKLEDLKTVIPQSETGSGYVPRSSRRYGTYSYASGSTVYINSRYYYGTYTVFRAKTMSSSPAMTRSVEGIAHNATLEDLDQRIDALNQILQTWNRKTSEMSGNGTSGIMRRANEAYLEGLREFTKEFVNLRKEVRKVERKQESILQNRASILNDWKQFENNRLPLLEEYFNSNALEIIETTEKGSYILPSFKENHMLYACEIGERTLYFKLGNDLNEKHPFILVNIDPVK